MQHIAVDLDLTMSMGVPCGFAFDIVVYPVGLSCGITMLYSSAGMKSKNGHSRTLLLCKVPGAAHGGGIALTIRCGCNASMTNSFPHLSAVRSVYCIMSSMPFSNTTAITAKPAAPLAVFRTSTAPTLTVSAPSSPPTQHQWSTAVYLLCRTSALPTRRACRPTHRQPRWGSQCRESRDGARSHTRHQQRCCPLAQTPVHNTGHRQNDRHVSHTCSLLQVESRDACLALEK